MFKDLTNFKLKRTALPAFGFYIAYLILTILLAMIIAQILGLISGQTDNFEFGINIGQLVAIVVCLYLTYAVSKTKSTMKGFSIIIWVAVAGVLAILGGALLGLIPSTYLTTKK